MTPNTQNGPAGQSGMPGPASNMPGQGNGQARPGHPQQAYPGVAQGAQQMPHQAQPMPQQMPQQARPAQRAPQGAQPGPDGKAPRGGQPSGAGAGNGGSGGNGGNGKKAPRSEKGKRNLRLLIGGIVSVVIVIVCALVFANGFGNNGFYDSSAKEGQASYKTLEEIEAERNRQMQEGMLNISIASVIEFQNGTSPGTAYIENVPSNRYVLKVTITTDSNGEVVYQSGGIKPDSFIEQITLTQPLAAGTYPSTATFTAYDPNTLEEVGQAAAKVTLVVDE